MWDDRSQWENCTPVFGLLAGSVVCLSLIAGPVGIYSVDSMDSMDSVDSMDSMDSMDSLDSVDSVHLSSLSLFDKGK